jgi:hypothetical protein
MSAGRLLGNSNAKVAERLKHRVIKKSCIELERMKRESVTSTSGGSGEAV